MAGALANVVAGWIEDDRERSGAEERCEHCRRAGSDCGVIPARESQVSSDQAGDGCLPGVGEDRGVGSVNLEVDIGGITKETKRFGVNGDLGEATVLERHGGILAFPST